jgi:transcriptional regulator with XRE-family HTH domain
MAEWELIDELKSRRRALGLRQEVIAVKIGVCTNQVSVWERKARRPRIDLLEAWGQALGLKLKWEKTDG